MQSIAVGTSFVARQLVAVGISLCGESFGCGSCKNKKNNKCRCCGAVRYGAVRCACAVCLNVQLVYSIQFCYDALTYNLARAPKRNTYKLRTYKCRYSTVKTVYYQTSNDDDECKYKQR
jgi:hypothetical protein